MRGSSPHGRGGGAGALAAVVAVTAAVAMALAGCAAGSAAPSAASRSSLRGSAGAPGTTTGTPAPVSSFPGDGPGHEQADGAAGSPHSPAAGGASSAGVVAPIPTAAMPADLTSGPGSAPDSADCARLVRPAGWLAAENALPGTPLPQLPAAPANAASAAPQTVLGYLGAPSAVCGDQVDVHLSGAPRWVRLAAYRVGWYGGAQARLVWQSEPVQVSAQAQPTADPTTHLAEPAWPTTLSFTVGEDWTPGVYALVPQEATPADAASRRNPAVGPMIPLVVRDDAGAEPALFMASTLTWNAYGDWGGASLYGGPGPTAAARYASRARVVALHRPLTGGGYDQLRWMDLPVVRWLETLGIDVAYTTDDDVDARPSQLARHAELVTGGHSEYWTTRMYDALEAVVAQGVNVAFLGANNIWWHARIEDDRRHEVVYRYAGEDPAAKADPAQATVVWSTGPLHRDMGELTGQTHAAIDVRGGLQLVHPPAWITQGTTLRDGSLLPGAVGNEADGYNPAARRPRDLQVLAVGVLQGFHGPVLVTTNYVTAPSGAAIFAAGATDWACSLGPGCSTGRAPRATELAVQQLTRNVVLAFATPAAGRRNPAEEALPAPADVLAAVLAPAARGTYGGARQD